MKLATLSTNIAKHVTLVVIAVTCAALFIPASFSWMNSSWITPLLGVVMFGMGLTLSPDDFRPIFARPKDIVIGVATQFFVMPAIAWALCMLFQLPKDIALGIILVGCCPGGTASNVICYLGKGDIALSVAMTAVSTFLAPFITPVLVLMLADKAIQVDVMGLFMSIIQVIIAPILVGFAVKKFMKTTTQKITPLLPMTSTIAIAIIIGIVVSHNSESILTCSLMVVIVVIIHNLLGYLLGYLTGYGLKLTPAKCRAISIEVGMQNSGLATSLATAHFAMYPMTAVPGAIFSAWHNFSGSIVASFFRKMKD